jgi:hypothetical protein
LEISALGHPSIQIPLNEIPTTEAISVDIYLTPRMLGAIKRGDNVNAF